MKTFSVATLGCRVNHYEAEQIAAELRRRGLTQVPAPGGDVRVVHTCSVTSEAAAKSRQATRRAARLPLFGETAADEKAKVIVTGCWAESNRTTASAIDGVTAVLGHTDDVRSRLDRLFDEWTEHTQDVCATPVAVRPDRVHPIRSHSDRRENRTSSAARGMTSLPQLHERQTGHQRAFLKVQDGCDAHCTYCIIPQLRPTLWSKTVDDAVDEATALVRAGHREIVLTGIFLGAFGQPTALRRRQPDGPKPLQALIRALCTRVPSLIRLRMSSLEPGDLDADLLSELRRHEQVVPHFHLPLQSGSDAMLRRMNRQYTRGQFLEMVAAVREAYDRPAITTDIIAGFPGEDDAAFADTVDAVRRCGFVHVHAFPYSPRPDTAAARWTDKRLPPAVVDGRMQTLRRLADAQAAAFAESFIGETVAVLVEPPKDATRRHGRHGRCERYFDVEFESQHAAAGDLIRLRVDGVTDGRAFGSVL